MQPDTALHKTSALPAGAWVDGFDGSDTSIVRAEDLVAPGCRAVVVTPVPDIELMAIGGLLGQLAQAGRAVTLIVVTDGRAAGASHELDQRLVSQSRFDSEVALTALGISALTVHLGFAPGRVAYQAAELADAIHALLLPGDVLFATWNRQGGLDHTTVARAARAAADELGLTMYEACNTLAALEYTPDRARHVQLDAAMRERKQAALQTLADVEPVEVIYA